jgi:hypothetical protein
VKCGRRGADKQNVINKKKKTNAAKDFDMYQIPRLPRFETAQSVLNRRPE